MLTSDQVFTGPHVCINQKNNNELDMASRSHVSHIICTYMVEMEIDEPYLNQVLIKIVTFMFGLVQICSDMTYVLE